MTLRIFVDVTADEAIVALHGWLSVAEVAELERVAASQVGSLRIDLLHLVGVDADGIRALQRLRGRGARLTGASPFVDLMLERTAEAGNEQPE